MSQGQPEFKPGGSTLSPRSGGPATVWGAPGSTAPNRCFSVRAFVLDAVRRGGESLATEGGTACVRSRMRARFLDEAAPHAPVGVSITSGATTSSRRNWKTRRPYLSPN